MKYQAVQYINTQVHFEEKNISTLFYRLHSKMAAVIYIVYVKNSNKKWTKCKLPPPSCNATGKIIITFIIPFLINLYFMLLCRYLCTITKPLFSFGISPVRLCNIYKIQILDPLSYFEIYSFENRDVVTYLISLEQRHKYVLLFINQFYPM